MALHPQLNLLGLERSIDLERYCKGTLGYKRLAVSRKRLSERLNRELSHIPIPDCQGAIVNRIHWVIEQIVAVDRNMGDGIRLSSGRSLIKTTYRKAYLKDIPTESIVYKFKMGHRRNVHLDTGECVTYLDDIDFNEVPGIPLY